jgi:hypothetical protein
MSHVPPRTSQTAPVRPQRFAIAWRLWRCAPLLNVWADDLTTPQLLAADSDGGLVSPPILITSTTCRPARLSRPTARPTSSPSTATAFVALRWQGVWPKITGSTCSAYCRRHA